MNLARIVETSQRLTATSKRTEKIALLAQLLGEARGEEIETAVAFLCGTTRQGKIGVGYRTLQGSMETGAGREPAPLLTLAAVEHTLDELAKVQGAGSEKRKRELLGGMMSQATAEEQRFLFALLIGELRQGSLEGVMVEGIAKAAGIPADRVRRAVMLAGDIVPVARAAVELGLEGLAPFGVQLFRPLQPMLANTAEDTDEALAELGEASLEFKLDGARVQAHKDGDEVRLYSRAGNEVTAAAPEVVEVVRAMPARSLILDGEALSLRADGRPQPFQVTARRFGRKLDMDRMRAELPLTPFWFDLLYLDGADMLGEPQRARFGSLQSIAAAASMTPHIVTADAGLAAEFLERARGAGHEGIMAKSPASVYAAGARGQSWLKIKPAATLDLVILAAEWGNGRRKGWLSNLHLGARDEASGGFAMLGKTFKGLTDEMLAWQTAELLRTEIGRDAYTVYVEPSIVAEIAFHEFQVSTKYASGLALRFARVKRYRADKKVGEADTMATVRKIAGF